MHRIQHSFAIAARPDRFVCLVSSAQGVGEVIGAVRAYLETWPPDKVASVQKVDAGWAPFDETRKAVPVQRAADLHRLCATVHGQCSALRSAGVSLAPALLELDLFLFFACTKLSELEARTCS